MTKPSFFDSKSPPHIVTLVIIAGLGALNMNILLPSLPSMTLYFDTSYTIMQLAVSAYLAGTAVAQIFIGPLSDRYGRRPVMLASLVIFIVGTLICLFATTIEMFLFGRMVQTVIATGVALSRAVVRDTVSESEAASRIGYITMGMSIVPMLGPAVGGYLEEIFGWQASFITTLALATITLFIVYVNMGETNIEKSSSLKEQIRAYPELLRSRRFWGYSLSVAFAAGAFFAFLGGSPYLATELFNMTPIAQGASFFFTAFGYMVGNFFSGRYAARLGIMTMMMSGGIVATIGVLISLALFATGFNHMLSFFVPMVLLGVGNGMTLPSANAGIVSVRPALAGSASGLGGALMVGGGAALAALAGHVLGLGTGPYPLLILMLLSLIASIAATAYVHHVNQLLAT